MAKSACPSAEFTSRPSAPADVADKAARPETTFRRSASRKARSAAAAPDRLAVGTHPALTCDMVRGNLATLDGNEAAASVAYRLNEIIGLYPITPASPMGELCDEWATSGRTNVWGMVPSIIEMQSEGGAAGVVHGALQGGGLATTFTASQGLLLMLPNLYKIAGELTPCVIHVAARTVATHALSIFCDHSDVMACRQTGFALLCSSSVQAAHDLALASQAASWASRVPFLHFFDGFRTSHELNQIELLSDEDLMSLVDPALIDQHRARGLNPERPVIRGTAQNPDAFFQAREASNPYYEACPEHLSRVLARLGERTGRHYHLFEYEGSPNARRVIVVMGSAAHTVRTVVRHLNERGADVGVLEVRLYRPFSVEHFAAALPKTVERIAVLDRTKEPGAIGEPLYLDVLAALAERRRSAACQVIGGRYGLSSKEFTCEMVVRIFEELDRPVPRTHFTVGIVDDITHLSLEQSLPGSKTSDVDFDAHCYQAVFFGLGSDGTVGANKNTLKILAHATNRRVQGYFVYDSKKAGSVTVSHLRFSEQPIEAPYLIDQADFVGCHQFDLMDRLDVVPRAKPGAIVLLNTSLPPEGLWRELGEEIRRTLADKKVRLFCIDAYKIAEEEGLGRRINTIMQTCFFRLTDLLPFEQALEEIKATISTTYERKGAALVEKNLRAVDRAVASLRQIPIEPGALSNKQRRPFAPGAPQFVQRVTQALLAGHGDLLPVSAFPPDGTWPTATAQWEKRNLAQKIPIWDAELCIQCNKCALMCPHAAIRAKIGSPDALAGAPEGFTTVPFREKHTEDVFYTLQVAPEDCTGCELCVQVCPAKDRAQPRHKALDMVPRASRVDVQREHYDYFLGLPDKKPHQVHLDVKGSQLLRPLFEYSGACPGCGETPYIKLLTQLFGDRLLIANATGCSSIYGGNLPTTPYAKDAEGCGPAWSNSLFEDNAEFGLGFRLSEDAQAELTRMLLRECAAQVGDDLVTALLDTDQTTAEGIALQQKRVETLRRRLATLDPKPQLTQLAELASHLVKRSVWLVGGDGWAYDIGYGGLDHVLASRHDVNVLVLDTEVYSNTGGQQSKATPLAAAAKFASAGKESPKKDLGLLAMSYGHVYVASVALGAKDAQAVRAFQQADGYDGPSLIIAYSHCIAHGYDMAFGAEQQKLAVSSGIWPVYHFDPRDKDGPLFLEGGHGQTSAREYFAGEMRFRLAEKKDPRRFKDLIAAAERDVIRRREVYRRIAEEHIPTPERFGKRER